MFEPLGVLMGDTQMEHLDSLELLTPTMLISNTPKAWGGGWGSRGDSASTCVWWLPSTERSCTWSDSRPLRRSSWEGYGGKVALVGKCKRRKWGKRTTFTRHKLEAKTMLVASYPRSILSSSLSSRPYTISPVIPQLFRNPQTVLQLIP